MLEDVDAYAPGAGSGSAVRPLAAGWLAAHGGGGASRLQSEQKQDLRGVLQRELTARAGAKGGTSAATIKEEVDRFLDIGRVSESNLGRLERRVLRACRDARGSAAGSDCSRSAISEFSAAQSQRPGSQSARGPAAGGADFKAMLGSVPESAQPKSARGPLGKWSEVAELRLLQEAHDKATKKVALRTQQEQMRQHLNVQIEEKERRKQQLQEEDKHLLKKQEADLEKWKAIERTKEEEKTRKAHEEKVEREAQTQLQSKLREEERKSKLDEDRRLVKLAEKELKEEKRVAAERKERSKLRQKAMAAEWSKGKGSKEDERRRQREEELQKVEEYKQMLVEQEARNKQPLNEVMGVGSPKRSLVVRRGEEAYGEQAVLQQLKEANQKAEQAERQKVERLKAARLSNQDFLFQQMAERDKNRRRVQEQRVDQKEQAKAAIDDFTESEKKRLQEQRAKNLRYRQELEGQIAAKKATAKLGKDDMSQAEKAINHHLITEAAQLRQEVDLIMARSAAPKARAFDEESCP